MFPTILLIIHVVGVIIWIGGVAFVTMVIFPMMYRTEGSLEKALLFQGVEHRFSAIVRWLIAVVGGTGFYLLSAKHGLSILSAQRGLGIVSMLFVWTFYTAVLLLEKKIFGKLFADPEKTDMDRALKMINAMHWVLLTLSFTAVAGGIWFAHR
ncbi:MAG: hypothetical protein AABZ15_04225 [Nitrospirota bacterium]